ncbi:MAG: flavin reductase [Cyclobacteriaceae bacterium]
MKRPWNIIDVPVYSLATYEEGRVNMNIATYVTPISLKPKQYAVAVYYNTKTYHNLFERGEKIAVLQVLHREQIDLVRSLGKKSGLKFSKLELLERKDRLTEWNGLTVLDGACAYIELMLDGYTDTGGDHRLCWFSVRRFKTIQESGLLTFSKLVEEGIIL